jgi:hypothetical protein
VSLQDTKRFVTRPRGYAALAPGYLSAGPLALMRMYIGVRLIVYSSGTEYLTYERIDVASLVAASLLARRVRVKPVKVLQG